MGRYEHTDRALTMLALEQQGQQATLATLITAPLKLSMHLRGGFRTRLVQMLLRLPV